MIEKSWQPAGVWGSARVSRVGDRVFAITDFSCAPLRSTTMSTVKDCFGVTPKPTRETRALPGRRSSRSGYNRSRLTRALRAGDVEWGVPEVWERVWVWD